MKKGKPISAVIILIVLFVPAAGMLFAGRSEEPLITRGQLKTYVSILPQSYFVERIGGEKVSVDVLIKPGQDPHTFEPTPGQVMALEEADLYFGIGFPFEEKILKKVQGSNPQLVLIRTDRGVHRRKLEAQYHEDTLDPHIWLSQPEIKIQVTNIYEGLTAADPENADIYRKNFDEFLDSLQEVHEKLLKIFEPYRGCSFFVFHPFLGYFADVYGLVQVPIEIEGKSPTPKQIESLIAKAKSNNVKIIFVSPQFARKSAGTIADAIGGAVVSINPLEKNVLKNLEDIAMKIESSLK